MNTSQIALSGLVAGLATAYVSSPVLGFVAVAMSTLALTYQNHPLTAILGAVITYPNTVTLKTFVDKDYYVYYIVYEHPNPFSKLEFTFPPGSIDAYLVQTKEGKHYTKQPVVPGDSSIVIYNRHAKSDGIKSIKVSLFFRKGGPSDLQKFRTLFSNPSAGNFVVYSPTNAKQVIKSPARRGDGWTSAPSSFI
jgi:hypothetical protein